MRPKASRPRFRLHALHAELQHVSLERVHQGRQVKCPRALRGVHARGLQAVVLEASDGRIVVWTSQSGRPAATVEARVKHPVRGRRPSS